MFSDQEGQGEFARAFTGTLSVGTLTSARSGPTVLRIALGSQLRRLREASNLTTAQAAEAIRGTHSKISRLERGRSAARPRDVADLLSLYGVTDEAERDKLLALARAASAPGWWQQYSDVLPRWLELYIGLEKAASVIRTYEVQFVHGLMQTEDYARAVILISNAHASAEEIERRVNLRMQRQRLLIQPDAPELWAVLDEDAGHRRPDSRLRPPAVGHQAADERHVVRQLSRPQRRREHQRDLHRGRPALQRELRQHLPSSQPRAAHRILRRP